MKLRPDRFRQLSAALGFEPSLCLYAEDKLRLDYDAISKIIHVPMPTPTHDFSSAGKFAANIRKRGSSRIILQGNEAKPVI
ncbi:hypothetical protein PGQ11_007827 [Apiospora arundinis]|uniref:Uncharacterized protein n=1 Tax=Apiospora arundinis TaxID=335852 RepID=A0ABR2IWM9_9PEZI